MLMWEKTKIPNTSHDINISTLGANAPISRENGWLKRSIGSNPIHVARAKTIVFILSHAERLFQLVILSNQ